MVDRERQLREVVLSEYQGNDRRQEVTHERRDHCAKRGPDDNGHGQVDDVPTKDELLEVAEHTHIAKPRQLSGGTNRAHEQLITAMLSACGGLTRC